MRSSSTHGNVKSVLSEWRGSDDKDKDDDDNDKDEDEDDEGLYRLLNEMQKMSTVKHKRSMKGAMIVAVLLLPCS